MLRWPDAETVTSALRKWADGVAGAHHEVLAIGYFGSYARGDWGVGSDLDVVVLVSDTEQPLERRSLAFDATNLPVPVDLLVYTAHEWNRVAETGPPGRTRADEIVWVLHRD